MVNPMSSSTIYPAFSEDEKKKYQKQISDLVQRVKNLEELNQNAIDKLRATADHLDKVWKDCKIASAVGSATGIVEGLLTIGGGIATILTAGIASPLLITGIVVGAAGAGTNLGTSAIENVINSSQVKAAEEAVKDACAAAQEVRDTIALWQKRRDLARLLSLGYVALQVLELDAMAISIIQGVLQYTRYSFVQTGETCASALAETTTKAAGKAGVKIASKAAGSIIIGTSAVFIVWDAVGFGFTVRDLIEKKGSDAAKSLRQKANEIEENHLNSH